MFEQIAYAAPAQGQSQANPLFSFLPLVLLIGIFYFLLIRPQQKKQKDLQKMVSNLKKGDRVVTIGGIIGEVSSLQDDYVVIRFGEGNANKMEVLKSAVSGIREPNKS